VGGRWRSNRISREGASENQWKRFGFMAEEG